MNDRTPPSAPLDAPPLTAAPKKTSLEAKAGATLSPTPPARRSFRAKLFDIGWRGWAQLTVLCLAVGAVLRGAGVNPFDPHFNLAGAGAAMAQASVNLVLWILSKGWEPALAGAAVVVPLWLIWRLLSSPFRR